MILNHFKLRNKRIDNVNIINNIKNSKSEMDKTVFKYLVECYYNLKFKIKEDKMTECYFTRRERLALTYRAIRDKLAQDFGDRYYSSGGTDIFKWIETQKFLRKNPNQQQIQPPVHCLILGSLKLKPELKKE